MVVLQYIASPFWGGGEQYVFDLSRAMQTQHGVRTIFVCQPGTSEELLKRWEQVGHIYTLHPKTKNGKFSYLEACRLARIMEREQVDILHMHELKDFFLCAYAKLFCRRKIRLIATRHIIGQAKSKTSWLWAYRQIDAMIFNSQLTADTFLSAPAVRHALPHTFVVRNSIVESHAEDQRISIREAHRIDPALPLILYHGRICREKGIVQLLQALAVDFSKQYAVILAGTVSEDVRMDLEALCTRSPMKGFIYPIGFRRDITNMIAQCDLGILPSIVPEAGGPLTLLEHMEAGSAVIASDNGSQPEYAANGKEAILLPPGQWEAWKQAIERVLNDKTLAQQLGREAKKRFEKEHTYSNFIEKLYEIYIAQ